MLFSHHATIAYQEAYAYLARDVMGNLALLGALEYEAVAGLHGVMHGDTLVALALVLEPEGPLTQQRTPVMLAANDAQALDALLDRVVWPRAASFVLQQHALLPALEAHLGMSHIVDGGLLYFITDVAPHSVHPLVRRLTLADADLLDLSPCGLSAIALRNWIKRGWRVFGAIEHDVLLAHALAAYPITGTVEVSAVFTAPQRRRQGLASAVVGAAIADIVAGGKRAVYACKRTNVASQRVALALGLSQISETYEVLRIDDSYRPV